MINNTRFALSQVYNHTMPVMFRLQLKQAFRTKDKRDIKKLNKEYRDYYSDIQNNGGV